MQCKSPIGLQTLVYHPKVKFGRLIFTLTIVSLTELLCIITRSTLYPGMVSFIQQHYSDCTLYVYVIHFVAVCC